MQFYQCITDFIFVEDEPRRSDIIFVPGGNYPDTAEHAAKLYHAGYAPYIMPSGKYSILNGRFLVSGTVEESRKTEETGKAEKLEKTESRRRAEKELREEARMDGEISDSDVRDGTYATECDYLCDILRRCGIPDQVILREERATYTYENAIFSRRRIQELGLRIDRAILCCQAFHARRCLMYYQEQFPDTEFLVCPVVTKDISRESWHRSREGIDTVLGELERCGGQFHEIMYEKLLR